MTYQGESGLPDFSDPPVDETALSIQFVPIPRFGIPHFGLFWARVRDEYARFEVQPPITNVTEQPGPVVRAGPSVGLQLMSLPEVRCWFVDKPGNRLIQVQHDRFVHNWRRLKGDEEYPRYPALRDFLEREWSRFCEFLASEKLEAPNVNQCEVMYVNHIEYEKGWSGYGELEKVVAAIAPSKPRQFLPAPERVNMQLHYRLADNSGRLHISFVPVIRGRDGKEVLQMTLVARGAPKSSNNEDIFSWLDLGRKWVVKGFTDFTTEEMHKIWGRQ